MKPSKRLAAAWLRIPERGVDILSILLAGAGINLITAVPANPHAVVFLFAGLAITIAAVIVFLLKHRADGIWRSVESNLHKSQDELNEFLKSGGKLMQPKLKTSSELLTEAIVDFMDYSPDSVSVTRHVLLASVLVAAGIAATVCVSLPFGSSEEDKNQQKQEVFANTLKSVQNQIDHLSSDFKLRSKAMELQLQQFTENQTNQFTNVDKQNGRIESEIQQLRSDISTLANSLKVQEFAPGNEKQ